MNLEKQLIYVPRSLEFIFALLAAWLVAGYLTASPLGLTTILPPETIHTHHDSALNLDTPIFGKPAVQAKAPPTVVAKPVVQQATIISKLNIKLIGTVVAGDRSAAIVSINNNPKQQFFNLHATMQAHVTLEKVEARAIVVNHSGKFERITMEKEQPLTGGSIAQNMTYPHASKSRQTYQPRRLIHRAHLNQQMRNFSRLLTQARVIPHFTQGKADGFTIVEIVPGSLYEQIGLQNGDVIHKVNGQTITSAEQAMTMYQTLQNAPSIDLELLRGGSVVPIHYDIQ